MLSRMHAQQVSPHMASQLTWEAGIVINPFSLRSWYNLKPGMAEGGTQP